MCVTMLYIMESFATFGTSYLLDNYTAELATPKVFIAVALTVYFDN
jgi:hypothetical protein